MAGVPRTKVPGIPHLWQQGKTLTVKVPATGKYVKLKATTHADAKREIAHFVAHDAFPTTGNIRMRDAWPEIRDAKGECGDWSPATVQAHEGRWNEHCATILGPLRVSEVDSVHIRQVLDRMREVGYERGGAHHEYTETTIGHVFTTLSGFFSTAKADPFNYTQKNPCEKVGLFKPSRRASKAYGKFVVFSEDELDSLARAAESRYDSSRITSTLLRLKPGTGMRTGEILGLRWTAIDLREGKLTLTEQLRRGFLVDDPSTWFGPLKGDPEKVGNEARIIPLLDEEWRLLREYREWLMSVGLYQADGLVFPTLKRTPIGHSSLQGSFARAIKLAGITREEKKPSLHWLRHSYASRMFNKGVPLEKVSAYLGHSTPKITRDRYVHLISVRDEHDAVRALFR